MKKLLALMLSVALVLSFIPAAYAVDTYSDTKGHWAETMIEEWSALGIIKGSNGEFRPDDAVTRGELAVILDRIMDYQTKADNDFSDLSSEFYTDAVLGAAKSGVIQGYPDGTVKPKLNISRQDAMVMLCRAFGITAKDTDTVTASDAASISSYAASALAALQTSGIIQGRQDGKLYPAAKITRAEIIQILDKLVGAFYNKGGTYSENITGSVIVNVPDVVLKDMTITGSLIIASGVGSGDITLENVNITGDVIINGGGVNSVKLLGNTSVSGTVHIKKVDGEVRLYTEDGVEIATTVVDDGCDDVVLEGTFANVQVDSNVTVSVPEGSAVESMTLNTAATIAGAGTVTSVAVSEKAAGSGEVSIETNVTNLTVSADVTVDVAEGVTVTNLTLDTAATVTGDGTVTTAVISAAAASTGTVTLGVNTTNLTVNADVTVAIESGTTVASLTLSAAADITGTGTITSATVTVSGATFETKPTTVTAASGITLTIGTTEYKSDGKTLTATSSTNNSSNNNGGTTVSVTGVTLYMNSDALTLPATVSGSTYTFDLTDTTTYPDSTVISGLKVVTNNTSSTTYTFNVGTSYSINTDTKVSMGDFLKMAGLTSTTEITLGKIRLLKVPSISQDGTFSGTSSTITIVFKVATSGYYTVATSGTDITATLNSTYASTEISALNTLLTVDPVAALVSKIQTSSAYVLTVKNLSSGTTVTLPTYSYDDIKGMTLATLVDKINNTSKWDYTVTKLSDLTNIKVTLAYTDTNGTAHTISLTFAQ